MANNKKRSDVIQGRDASPDTRRAPAKRRTAKDFVEDMLASGDKEWTHIVSVARQVRKGAWYKDVTRILQERGLMPTDPGELKKAAEKVRKRAANPNRVLEIRRARLPAAPSSTES